MRRAPSAAACAVLGALLATGCIDDGPEPVDAGPDAAEETRCGTGPISVALGVGNPFEGRPGHDFSIEQGLQGGYHVDISLRMQGTIDPDHVDIQLDLLDGERRIARHLTNDWLLHLMPDGPYCDYPRARLVLTDGEGGLLPEDQVEALVGRELELAVYLRSPLGEVDADFRISIDDLVRFR